MDSDEGKLFIGGIAWDTNEDKLIDYFKKYGDVSQAVVMRDRSTGRPRGFAFVVFADPSAPDRVLQEKHVIDGRTVDAKKALSREEQQTPRPGNSNNGKGTEVDKSFRTKKIFVGGLPSNLTEAGFHQYFETYGRVTDVVIMYDQNTQRPRGFGFISFDSEDAVDRVLHKTFHELSGKSVEVKRALPKDANPGGVGRMGGYQASGVSSANTGAFSNQMDDNRYIKPQSTVSNFSMYAGYGGLGYGYGSAHSFGIGGYGGYDIGGYGRATTGFFGPAGAFVSPNIHGAGYLSGPPPNALKTVWSNQIPGYGASGYGFNAGYGVMADWNFAGSGGAVSAPIGLFPSGITACGSQGHDYGNTDASSKPSSNFVGYGTSGNLGNLSNSNASVRAAGADQGGAGSGGHTEEAYSCVNGS